MKKLIQIAAVGMLPLLAGCYDLEQGMAVDSDGTATLSIEFAISADVMAQLSALGEGDESGISPCDNLDEDFAPESFAITLEEFERDGDVVCRIVAAGPIEELAAETPDTVENGDGIALAAEGGGIYRFQVSATSSADEQLGDPNDPATAELFEGRTVTFFLTAPRIIETNGEVDGDTVTLVIPTIELMTIDDEVYSLYVRFGL